MPCSQVDDVVNRSVEKVAAFASTCSVEVATLSDVPSGLRIHG